MRLYKDHFLLKFFPTRFNIHWWFSNSIVPSVFISWRSTLRKNFYFSSIYAFTDLCISVWAYGETRPPLMLSLLWSPPSRISENQPEHPELGAAWGGATGGGCTGGLHSPRGFVILVPNQGLYLTWKFGFLHFYSQVDAETPSLRAETQIEHSHALFSSSIQAPFSPLQCVCSKAVVNVSA